MEKRVKYLVVDSGAFIKASPVHEYAENVYSVNGAIKEIKDKANLQALQFLPYELSIKAPSTEACKHVQDFARKTGDYSSLSSVDLQIIALTYQLEKEYVGTQHLNKNPSCQVTDKSRFVDKPLSGFYIPKKKSEDPLPSGKNENPEQGLDIHTYLNSTEDKIDSFLGENQQEKQIITDATLFNSNSPVFEEYSDDEDSWLTPQNIAQAQMMGGMQLASSVRVACITTDFAIQNVLIQMGLNVISVEGMIIKQARVYILRCFSCFKTTNDTTKLFCPNCGNKTLKRVAVTVNEDGSKNIHINFKRPINIRGMRYSLPMPKGGRHSINPLLVEDQPIPHNRPKKKALDKVDVMSEDYVVSSSPFAFHDVYSRAAHLGILSNLSRNQFSKRNPNSSHKFGRRKK